MASSQTVKVDEARRTIVFRDGQRLELSNVTAFNSSGTMLRLWSDEGFFMISPARINYHQIQYAPRQDEADDMAKAAMTEAEADILADFISRMPVMETEDKTRVYSEGPFKGCPLAG